MGSLFKRGYSESRKEIERQEERRKQMGNQIYRFFVPADKRGKAVEKDVVFLTEEPVNFQEHTKAQGANYINYTCKGKNCPLCKNGDRPTAKAAYLIVDLEHFEYTDKNGKTHEGDERIRMFVQGMRSISQLDRVHSKHSDFLNRIITVVRMGAGKSTSYTYEVGDKIKMSRKHIKELLPDDLADDWDGTQDGLMDIIEEQLSQDFPDDDEDFNDEDERDDYDDDDFDDGDDDEEEEKPKRRKASKVKKKDKKKKHKLSSKLSGGRRRRQQRDDDDDDDNEGFMDIDDDDDDEGIPFS